MCFLIVQTFPPLFVRVHQICQVLFVILQALHSPMLAFFPRPSIRPPSFKVTLHIFLVLPFGSQQFKDCQESLRIIFTIMSQCHQMIL
jgi:hypothetical protein